MHAIDINEANKHNSWTNIVEKNKHFGHFLLTFLIFDH
jgi:hypothetical protein